MFSPVVTLVNVDVDDATLDQVSDETGVTFTTINDMLVAVGDLEGITEAKLRLVEVRTNNTIQYNTM